MSITSLNKHFILSINLHISVYKRQISILLDLLENFTEQFWLNIDACHNNGLECKIGSMKNLRFKFAINIGLVWVAGAHIGCFT